ncbi:MAG: hypothetical protein E7493_08995 [Ruminococcus albus]|nr:hypothetical protein [Ruminococcus albus]
MIYRLNDITKQSESQTKYCCFGAYPAQFLGKLVYNEYIANSIKIHTSPAHSCNYRHICGICAIFNVVIPLTHHQNGGFTELKVVGGYLSPRRRRGKDIMRSIILLFTAFSAGVLK